MSLRALRISPKLLHDTHLVLRRISYEHGIEGVVLWQGTPEGIVTNIVIPEQRAGYAWFEVGIDARIDIARQLAGTGQQIVAQVHTHPNEAYHSPVDDALALPRTVGAFSLVVPEFAARDSLLDSAVLYQLSADGIWQKTDHRKITFLEGSSPTVSL